MSVKDVPISLDASVWRNGEPEAANESRNWAVDAAARSPTSCRRCADGATRTTPRRRTTGCWVQDGQAH